MGIIRYVGTLGGCISNQDTTIAGDGVLYSDLCTFSIVGLLWMQFVVQGASAKVGSGPTAGRLTQAFASAVPPTLPSVPTHVPHRLARFDFTHRSDGLTNLHVYSPPNSSLPIFKIWGLGSVPFLTFPIGYNFFASVGINDQLLQSVVQSYEPLGPIKGHVLTRVVYDGTAGLALYSRYETSDGLNMDGGLINVGLYIRNATTRLTVNTYPSS